MPSPEIIKSYLEKAGGTFIKIGQVLAMRPDFFPVEYCEALSSLFDEVKAFSPSRGIKIIEKELHAPIDQLFRYIETNPIAAASFGQVYKAEDRQGNTLAIKVMRPGIERIVFADIFFLKLLKFFLSLLRIGSRLGAGHLVDEVVEVLKEELDYYHEAGAIKLGWIAAQKIPYLRVPRLYEKFSTRKVLTMEFLEGTWMKDILSEIRKNGRENLRDITGKRINPDAITRRIFNIGMRQIFEHGFFHADPHSGNILIMANNEIGYIDFGITGWIEKGFRKKQVDYFRAIVHGDIEDALDAFTNMLIPHTNADINGFKRKLKPLLQLWIYAANDPCVTLSKKSTAQLLLQSINLARQHHFHLPLNVVRYYRSLLIVEPILLELNPDYDVRTSLRRYLMRFSMVEFHKMIQNEYENIVERNVKACQLFLAAPDFLRSIFDYVEMATRAPVTIRKGFSKLVRFFSELSYFFAFLALLLRVFFKTKNIAALFDLPFTIDYRFVIVIFLYIGYRLYKLGSGIRTGNEVDKTP